MCADIDEAMICEIKKYNDIYVYGAKWVAVDIISKLTKKRNLTTLVSIHQMDLIERFGDNLIVLKDKKIFAQGTKEEVFDQVGNR